MSAATITEADARTALLEAADALFYERGVVDVSMADVRDLSGLSMRRVYTIADSKSTLIAAWLRHRHETWMSGFLGRVRNSRAAGESAVGGIFLALEQWMVDTDFRGCGFINTYAESAETTEEHREIIRDHKRALAEILDELAGHGDALAVLVDGAIVQASIFQHVDPIRAARKAATDLIETISINFSPESAS